MLRGMIFFMLLLPFSTVYALKKEPYCNWDKGVSIRFVKKVDKELLSAKNRGASKVIKNALPFDLSVTADSSNNEKLLVQPNYITWYDSDLRSPLWVAYSLKGEDVRDGFAREESFRSDPRLEYWEKSDCADFKESIFDQGHMVPSADMKQSREAMASTYLMSNMTAQHCQFNRGQWQVLEEVVRDWAELYGQIWVVTGALYDRYGGDERDADQIAWRMLGERGARVAIPSHQYKIVVRQDNEVFLTAAFLMSNEDVMVKKDEMADYLNASRVAVEEIFSRSGFEFGMGFEFHNDSKDWPLPRNLAPPLTGFCKDDYADY